MMMKKKNNNSNNNDIKNKKTIEHSHLYTQVCCEHAFALKDLSRAPPSVLTPSELEGVFI